MKGTRIMKTDKDYYLEKIEECEIFIFFLENEIYDYEDSLIELHNLIVNTMKSPISEIEENHIIRKWNNKNRSIIQREKRMRKLQRRIEGYKKEISKIKLDIDLFNSKINQLEEFSNK